MKKLAVKQSAYGLQSGRSMIEMIGVLAIIGVLSMGGVAGYSKAMNKFRVNKAIEQVTQLSQNIRNLYMGQKRYADLTPTVIRKTHLVPDEMYESSGDNNIYNSFGGLVSIEIKGKKSSNDSRAFIISFAGIPQEACVEMLTHDWGSGKSSGLIAIGKTDNTTQDALYGCSLSTTTQCAKSGVMGVDQAVAVCEDDTNNSITWKFY